MLISKLARNPDYRNGFQTGRIDEKLAQVAMIRSLQLVFNQHPVARAQVLAEDISTEWADLLFLSLDFHIQADSVPQDRKIVRHSQPGRKISRFRSPDFSRIDSL
jgi:hypothetical protein